MSISRQGDLIVAQNPQLRLAIDATTGAMRSLRNRRTDQELLGEAPTSAPWRIYGYGTTATSHPPFPPGKDTQFDEVRPDGFDLEIDDAGHEARLTWSTTDPGVRVRVRLRVEEDALQLWPAVDCDDAATPERLVYPVLAAPQELSPDGGEDALAIAIHSGWLMRRPFEQPPIDVPYPHGLHGMSLQAMGYFRDEVGGFYLATHDPHSTFKRYAFSREEIAVHHHAFDLRHGAGLDLGYPVVLAALETGDWYEIAERYRDWALTEAPWTEDGPNWGRDDTKIARWLHEEVGLSLWGPPSAEDWSSWYRWYADAIGVPLHIVAGWDWPAKRPHALGYEGWFPARFHDANVEQWQGHRVTPYLNDQFISTRAEDFYERWEPHLFSPYVFFPFTIFSDPGPQGFDPHDPAPEPDRDVVLDTDYFLCPASEATQALHEWRDVTLIRDSGLDGVYYDISSGIPLTNLCLRSDHGHTPGWGRQLFDAYDENNQRTKRALLQETGTYPAQGVETIIENVIPGTDFYVSRGAAGPLGVIEAFFPTPEDPPGTGQELIPLFQAVYHDYGPVHQDGWLQFAERIGDVFYWVAARIMLQWGGILSLEYAITYPESYDDSDTEACFVGWDGAVNRSSELPTGDRDKVAFGRELALARTTYGTRYLGYGKLARPAGVASPTITVDFHEYWDAHLPGGRRHGTWEVPQVLESAWIDPLGNIGIFLVNLDGTSARTVELDVDTAQQWSVEAAGSAVEVTNGDASRRLAAVTDDGRLSATLELAPRRVVLVEILCGTAPQEQG